MKTLYVFAFPLLAALSCSTIPAFAQSDAEYFSEGRVALDEYKDCKAASGALKKVSAAVKKDPVWIYYMARTYECLEEYTGALEMYRKYNEAVPGQSEVLNKLGEIRYKLKKAEEEAALALEAESKLRAEEEAAARLSAMIFASQRIGAGLLKKISELNVSSSFIKFVTLLPDDNWIIVYNNPIGDEWVKKVTWSNGISDDLESFIRQRLTSGGGGIHNIASLPDGGWLHTSEWDHDVVGRIDNNLLRLLRDKAREGRNPALLHEVAIGPSSEWVASWFDCKYVGSSCASLRYHYAYSHNIPPELRSEIDKYNMTDIPVSVAFAPNGGWVILPMSGGFSSDKLSTDLLQELHQLHKEGRTLLKVSFAPEGNWVIVSSRAPSS